MKKPSIKATIAKNKSRAPKTMGSMMPMGGMKPSKGMSPMAGMKRGGMTKKSGLAIIIAVGKPRGRGK